MSNKREERKLSSASKNINEYFFGKESKRAKPAPDQAGHSGSYCHEASPETSNNNMASASTSTAIVRQQSISQQTAPESSNNNNSNSYREPSSTINKTSNKDSNNKFSPPKLFKQRSYEGKKQQQQQCSSTTMDACDIDSLMMINTSQDQLQQEEPPEHCVFRLGDYSQVAGSTNKNLPSSPPLQQQKSTHTNNIKANLRKLSNPTHRDLKLSKYLQYQGALPIAGNSSNFAASLAHHSRTMALIGESRIERVRKLITSPLSLRKASTGGGQATTGTSRLADQNLGTTSSPLMPLSNKSNTLLASIQNRSNPPLHSRRSPSRKQLNINYKVYGCPLQLANNSYPLTCFGRTETTHKLQPVPYVVTRLCNYIEENSASLTHEGMFRVSGNQRLMEKLRTLFDRLGDAPLESESVDVATSASMLKMYLRELPEPLIPVRMNHIFIAIAKKYTENDQAQSSMDKMTSSNAKHDTDTIAGIRSTSLTDDDSTDRTNPMQQMFARDLSNIVRQLPIDNYNSLKYLACFLYRVTLKQLINKMCASSLGIVFGPNIFRIRTDSYKGLKEQEFTNRVVACFISHYKYIFNSAVTDPLGNIVDTYGLENDLLSSLQRKYNKDSPKIQVKLEQESKTINLKDIQAAHCPTASTSNQPDQICTLPQLGSDISSASDEKLKSNISVCVTSCCKNHHSPASSCEHSCDEDDDEDESYTPSETTSCSNEYSDSIESTDHSEIYSASDGESSSNCHSITSYTPSSDMDQSSSESQSFESSTSFTSAEHQQSSKDQNLSSKTKNVNDNSSTMATTSVRIADTKIVDESAERKDVEEISSNLKPIKSEKFMAAQNEIENLEEVIATKVNAQPEILSLIATKEEVNLEDVVFKQSDENLVANQSTPSVSPKHPNKDKLNSNVAKDDNTRLVRNNPKSKSVFRRKKTSSRKRSSTSSNQDLSHSPFDREKSSIGQLQQDCNLNDVGETSLHQGVATKSDLCEKIKRLHTRGRHSRSSKRQAERRNIRKHMKRRSSSAGSLNRSKRLIHHPSGNENASVDLDDSFILNESQIGCSPRLKDENASKKGHSRHPTNKKDLSSTREVRNKSANSIIQLLADAHALDDETILDYPFTHVLPDITSELVVEDDPQLTVQHCALNVLQDPMEFYTFRRFNSDETLLRSSPYYENYVSFRRFSNQELGREEETYYHIESSMNNENEGVIEEPIDESRPATDDAICAEGRFILRKSNSINHRNQHIPRDSSHQNGVCSHAKKTKIKSEQNADDIHQNEKHMINENTDLDIGKHQGSTVKRNRHKSHDLACNRRETSKRIQRKGKDRSYSAGNDVEYKSVSDNQHCNLSKGASKVKKNSSTIDDARANEKLSSEKSDQLKLQRLPRSTRERGANLPKIQSISIVSLLETKENNVGIINFADIYEDGILDPIDEHLTLLKTSMVELKSRIKSFNPISNESKSRINQNQGTNTIVACSSSTITHRPNEQPAQEGTTDISKLVFELKHLRRRFNEMKRIRNHYECYHSTDKNCNNLVLSNNSIINHSSSSRSQGSLDSLKPQVDKVLRMIFSNYDISIDNTTLQSRSSSIKEFCSDGAFSPGRSVSMSFLYTDTGQKTAIGPKKCIDETTEKTMKSGEHSHKKSSSEVKKIAPVRQSLNVGQDNNANKQTDGGAPTTLKEDKKLKLECNFGMICPIRFVVDIEKRLNTRRKLCDRPYDTAYMTLEQLHDEKLELQKNLLRYEHWFGRPTSRQELSIVGHLYNRYRTIKQAQDLSKPKESGSPC